MDTLREDFIRILGLDRPQDHNRDGDGGGGGSSSFGLYHKGKSSTTGISLSCFKIIDRLN